MSKSLDVGPYWFALIAACSGISVYVLSVLTKDVAMSMVFTLIPLVALAQFLEWRKNRREKP